MARDQRNDRDAGPAHLTPTQRAIYSRLAPRSQAVIAQMSPADQSRYLRTAERQAAMLGRRVAAGEELA